MTSKTTTVRPLMLLKERDFSLLLIGQFISALGDKLHYIALGVLVYRLTGSALEVGKIALVTFLPYLLFGLIAGAYVDRWNKKRTMVLADLLRAGLVSLIPLMIGYSLNLVYLVAFLSTTANLFFGPAKMAVIPTLFNKEKILAATSLAESAENVTEIIGYALAGVITVLMRIENVFYLDALTFLVSAGSILAMHFRFEADEPETGTDKDAVTDAENHADTNTATPNIFQDIREGLAYIRQTRLLAVTLLTYCLVLLLFSGFNPLIFVYALKALGVTPVGLGVLEATAAVGITVGSLGISIWGGRFKKENLILSGYVLSGLIILLLGIYPWYPLALAGFFLTGISNAMFLLPIQSLFQEETAAPMRGRVFSARFALTRVAYMGSVAAMSLAANHVGVEKTYLASGLALLMVSLVLVGVRARPGGPSTTGPKAA